MGVISTLLVSPKGKQAFWQVSLPRRRREQKQPPRPTSPASRPPSLTPYPPFKLGGGPFLDAEVPRGQNESRGLGQGHGADSRGIHGEGGFGNVYRGSQLHIPHGLQTGRKIRSDETKYNPSSLQAASVPRVLVGAAVSWALQGAPLGQGPPGAPLWE